MLILVGRYHVIYLRAGPCSAAGGDILLLTPQGSNVSLVEYRMIGGVLDFYFFSGPTPNSVIEQYGELIGLPAWQPAWGFGFHLCRQVISTIFSLTF
jgi:alpha-glucosidase (family GH31 glycosyl hydrolase)